MAHNQEILDLVGEWQSKRFRESEISLSEAVASLASDDPLVVAQPGVNASRWILNAKDTKKVAVIVHAGIWAWKSDLETGNFVPEGCDAPDGLPENRIQDSPSFKCEFSYAFDTSVDASIWEHLQVLEDHVSSQPSFNKGNRPRRSWQSGKVASARQKYVVSAKVFAKRTPHNTKDGGEYHVPYEVHPWIMHGIDSYPEALQIPNPERPRYYDYTNGSLRKLEETNNPTFQKNDIVWMACKIGFIVSGEYWWSEIIPIEFIRVGKLPEHFISKSDPALFPPLDPDFELLEPGGNIVPIDSPARRYKRKNSDENLGNILSPSKKQALAEPDYEMNDAEEVHREAGGRFASGSKTRSKSNKENRPFNRT